MHCGIIESNSCTMDYKLMLNCLTYWTYTILWVGLYVSGQMTIKANLWRNRNVCVDGFSSLNKQTYSLPTRLCETILNTTTNKTHTVKGMFNADLSQMTNLTLNLSIECPDMYDISSCRAIEGNVSCPRTNLFCLYTAQSEIEGHAAIFARWPSVFGKAPTYRKRLCFPDNPATFHHNLFAYQELRSCISTNPNIFFWTDSYITPANDDELQQLLVTERTNLPKTTLKTCIHYCLNIRGNPKVFIIAYNSTEETCACFAKGNNGSRMPLFGEIFEIRDSDDSDNHIEHMNQLKGNRSCIAAIYRNSTINFHVKNCSFSYSILCGPYRCTRQETSEMCDYSGNTTRSIPRIKIKDVTTLVPYLTMHEGTAFEFNQFPRYNTSAADIKVKSSLSSNQESTVVHPARDPGEGISTCALNGILIAVFFILLISVGVFCYFKSNCGVLMWCVLMTIREALGGGRGEEDYSAAKTDDVENVAKKDELTEEAKGSEEIELEDGQVYDGRKEPVLSGERKVDTVDEIAKKDKLTEEAKASDEIELEDGQVDDGKKELVLSGKQKVDTVDEIDKPEEKYLNRKIKTKTK